MLLHKDFCTLPPVLPWARACEPSLSHWCVVVPSSMKLLPCFLLLIFPLAIRNVNTVFSLIGVFKSKEALRKSLCRQVSRGHHGLLSSWRLSVWSDGLGCELVGIAWQEIGAISRPQLVVDHKRLWTLTLCKIEMSGLSLFFLLKCSVSGLSIGVSLE